MSSNYAGTFDETYGETKQERIEREQAEHPNGNGKGQGNRTGVVFVPQTEFLAGFVPPDYIIDGVLQRRFIYALTGKTGGGKTAIALALARAVGCADPAATFGGHAAEKGKVVYFVGENADDVRARLIGTNARRGDNPDADRISYVVGVFDIQQMGARLVSEAQRVGGVDLVIIDTSAAYFLKDDENSNPQMGAHARMLRSLTTLPGDPCVIPLCHPIKYAADPSQLLPRGGGAFLAEVDGNLTAWRHDENLVELHHTDKFRGPGFEPITFKIEKITTPKLVDSKGRQMPTVQAIAINEAEEAEQTRNARNDENLLLRALLDNPERSHADLARACDFFFENGAPAKSRIQRALKRLEQTSPKLIRPNRDHWALTDEGRKLAEKLAGALEETIEDRGGTISSKAFFAVVGKRLASTVPCIHCNKIGEVYRVRDGRWPKGKGHAEALHEGCAKDWFEGKPGPEHEPEK